MDKKRLLVNDALTQIEGTRTFWHDLQDWFGMEFVGGEYGTLAESPSFKGEASLIVRNATFFPPIKTDTPTISLLQDIMSGGVREMQDTVIRESAAVVYNSEYTQSKYPDVKGHVIPLPIDFNHFEPENPVELQRELSLPDGCVCWVGAQTPIKGWDIFIRTVRMNPDIPFVAVLKDSIPASIPPNLRVWSRVNHDMLVKIYGACRVGLCTSRTETQHLAGIEMGAVGLPLVAPPVGCYYRRECDYLARVYGGPDGDYTRAIRQALESHVDPNAVHDYWRAEFDQEVVRKQWAALIEEVENCSGQS